MAMFFDLRQAGNNEEHSTPLVHTNNDGQIVVGIYPNEGEPEVFLVLGLREAKELSKKIADVVEEEINDLKGN